MNEPESHAEQNDENEDKAPLKSKLAAWAIFFLAVRGYQYWDESNATLQMVAGVIGLLALRRISKVLGWVALLVIVVLANIVY